jgi:oxygen-dependent protoporphyrinogen oxidase
MSVPADSLGLLLDGLSPDKARSIGKIDYPPVAMVYFGFKSDAVERELDGFGFLIPKLENRETLGSIWSSSLFPNRAPAGHVAFTTFVGGTRQPENALLDDDQLKNIVYNDLNDLVGLRGEPVFIRIKRWPRAIPQYTVGYKKYQDYFDDIEDEFPGLYFAGNYRGGISIGDSVVCAHKTVQKMTGQRSENIN